METPQTSPTLPQTTHLPPQTSPIPLKPPTYHPNHPLTTQTTHLPPQSSPIPLKPTTYHPKPHTYHHYPGPDPVVCVSVCVCVRFRVFWDRFGVILRLFGVFGVIWGVSKDRFRTKPVCTPSCFIIKVAPFSLTHTSKVV